MRIENKLVAYRVLFNRTVIFGGNITQIDMEKKVVGYKLLSALSAATISDEVMNSVNAGWQLFGGPFTNAAGEYLVLYQAMVKYDDAEDIAATYIMRGDTH